MNKKLLDDEEFDERIEELASAGDEVKSLLQSLSGAKMELITDSNSENYTRLKDIKDVLDRECKKAGLLLESVQTAAAGSEPRGKKASKHVANVSKQIQEYESKRGDYELTLRNHSHVAGAGGGSKGTGGGDKKGGQTQGTVNRGDDDVPVSQIYNQSEFIEKRQKDIEKLHTDAKTINTLAKDINTKIHDQDEKLDKVNDTLGKDVLGNMKDANKDLAEANDITKARARNYTFFIFVISVALLILGLSFYFMLK